MRQELAIRATVALLFLLLHEMVGGGRAPLLEMAATLGLVLNVPYYFAYRTGWRRRAQAFFRMCVDIELVTLGLLAAGGLDAAPYLGVYAIVPVYAGWAFSSRGALVAAWLATGSYLAVVVLQQAHWVAPPSASPASWVVVCSNLLVLNIVGGLTAVLADAYRTSLRLARETADRLRAMADSATDAIISSDGQGRIIASNRSAEAMFGYTKEEVLGLPMTRLIPDVHWDGVPPDLDRPVSEAGQGLVGSTQELRGVHKTGSHVPIELSLSSWRVGADSFFTAIVRNLTERRHLEGQLRQAQKLEAIGRLAGGVAHDFNNCLTVILGRAALLQRRRGLDADTRNEIQLVEQAADRAAQLTRQLLAFSRKQVLQPRVLDLNRVVSGLEPMLRRLIGEDIELVTALRPRLEAVKADLSQIEQVIMNLAVNARDAMPGGGRLTIALDRAVRDFSPGTDHAGWPRRYVVLRVTDTGTGMDPDTLKNIFEPFFTTKEPGKGTGLGLAMVYGFVTQSGGQVTVSSEPGRGTAFEIYLPQTDETVSAPTAAVPAEVPSGAETVLLVEDEAGVRGAVRAMLEAHAYTVLEAGDASAALRLVQEYNGRIDLLITDMVMPHVGGRELAERLRAQRPDLRVLFISGYTADGKIRDGAFLQKPFTTESLARAVRETLRVAASAR